MNALTICQPYAELICRGVKRVENRSWFRSTAYGPLLIHAGKSRNWLNTLRDRRMGITEMVFGAIVGRCNVGGIFAAQNGSPDGYSLNRWPWLAGQREHIEGPECWVLEDVERLERPFPCRGWQGLFDVGIEGLELEHGWPAIWLPAGPPARVCRVCGCTEHTPCDDPIEGACWWSEPDLCSACTGKESREGAKARRGGLAE